MHTSLMMYIGVCRVFEDEVRILLQGLYFYVVVILACSSCIAPSADSDLGFRFFSLYTWTCKSLISCSHLEIARIHRHTLRVCRWELQILLQGLWVHFFTPSCRSLVYCLSSYLGNDPYRSPSDLQVRTYTLAIRVSIFLAVFIMQIPLFFLGFRFLLRFLSCSLLTCFGFKPSTFV